MIMSASQTIGPAATPDGVAHSADRRLGLALAVIATAQLMRPRGEQPRLGGGETADE